MSPAATATPVDGGKLLRARDESSSSSSTRSTETKTVTFKSMTTPFSTPTECNGRFSPATTVTSTPRSWETQTTWVWAVEFSSTSPGCEPSGLGATKEFTKTEARYSPAVCPSGWTAYNIGAYTTDGMKTAAVEYSATCCASGFDLNSHNGPGYAVQGNSDCVQTVSPTTNIYSDGHATVSLALRLHKPWRVTWKADDVTKLSPAPPPQLRPTCANIQIYSWRPGQTVLDSASSTSSSSLSGSTPGLGSNGTARYVGECRQAEVRQVDHSLDGLFYFMVIGLPIIGVAILSCCVCCCVRGSRKRRRRLAVLTEVGTKAETTAREDAATQADAEVAREMTPATEPASSAATEAAPGTATTPAPRVTKTVEPSTAPEPVVPEAETTMQTAAGLSAAPTAAEPMEMAELPGGASNTTAGQNAARVGRFVEMPAQ